MTLNVVFQKLGIQRVAILSVWAWMSCSLPTQAATPAGQAAFDFLKEVYEALSGTYMEYKIFGSPDICTLIVQDGTRGFSKNNTSRIIVSMRDIIADTIIMEKTRNDDYVMKWKMAKGTSILWTNYDYEKKKWNTPTAWDGMVFRGSKADASLFLRAFGRLALECGAKNLGF